MIQKILRIFGKERGSVVNKEPDFVPRDILDNYKKEHPFSNLTEKQREVLFEAAELFVWDNTLDIIRANNPTLIPYDMISRSFAQGNEIVRVFRKLELISDEEMAELQKLSSIGRMTQEWSKETDR